MGKGGGGWRGWTGEHQTLLSLTTLDCIVQHLTYFTHNFVNGNTSTNYSENSYFTWKLRHLPTLRLKICACSFWYESMMYLLDTISQIWPGSRTCCRWLGVGTYFVLDKRFWKCFPKLGHPLSCPHKKLTVGLWSGSFQLLQPTWDLLLL